MRQGAGCCVRRRAVHSGAFFSLLGRVAAPVLLCPANADLRGWASGGRPALTNRFFGNRFESPEHSSVSQKFENLRGGRNIEFLKRPRSSSVNPPDGKERTCER